MAALPLSTLLAQTLVAHTIELDNEAEHLLPHRTSDRRDPSPQRRGAPWLVSYVLYANVLQYLERSPVTVAALQARARTGVLLLGGLRRWGYVKISAPAGEPLRNPPQGAALVTPTHASTTAQAVWHALPATIEERWRARFGDPAVEALAGALGSVYAALSIAPPAYLPVVSPTQGGKVESSPSDIGALTPTPLELSPLLSGVLWAFTIDVEARARISMAVGSNTLRVLEPDGVRLRDLPRLTGVSTEANAMCSGWLQRHACLVLEPDPRATRGKGARLTPKGARARRNFQRIVDDTEENWCARVGPRNLAALRTALESLVGPGELSSSPLAAGLGTYPDNWRAAMKLPDTLPHQPVVLHRGGYPDGS